MPRARKVIVFGLIAAALIVLTIIYGKLNPENFYLFPKCPFKLLTGFECPGCGSQRAIHYLLNLKINSAIRANVLLIFSIPYLLLLIALELLKFKNRFFMRLHRVFYGTKAIWTVFAVVMLWWIVRNLYSKFL